VAGALAERLRAHAADWARRRHGDDAHALTLKRRRIFILPTRFGVAFGSLVLAMLLGSLNYDANLGFALTFLLTGLGLVVMHHCHNNLLGVTIRYAGAMPVFAGEQAAFRLLLDSDTPDSRFDLVADSGDSGGGPADLAPGSGEIVHLNVAAPRRGYVLLPRFSLSSRYPGNLFRAWSWINMEARCLVYPEPAPPGHALPSGGSELGKRSSLQRDEDDFIGLRQATRSDPPRHLAWKAFARSNQLYAKQFAGGADRPCLFDFSELQEPDTERRLSQLTRWCLDAAAAGLSFGLILPDRRIALGSGEQQLHQCLEALALFGLDR
jgi:uncharacterized protein (DUF58 family)